MNPPLEALEGGSKPPKSDFSDLGIDESELGNSRLRCGFGEGATPWSVAPTERLQAPLPKVDAPPNSASAEFGSHSCPNRKNPIWVGTSTFDLPSSGRFAASRFGDFLLPHFLHLGI